MPIHRTDRDMRTFGDEQVKVAIAVVVDLKASLLAPRSNAVRGLVCELPSHLARGVGRQGGTI